MNTDSSSCTRDGRDPLGRFLPGNPQAAAGGQARAERLTPERRKEIATAGWWGLVWKHFGGDRERAARFLGALGAWANEESSYRDCPAIYKPNAYPRPHAPWDPDEIIVAVTYEEQLEAEAKGLPWAPF